MDRKKATILRVGRVVKEKSIATAKETKKLIHEFSEVTTLHGIRYLGERETHSLEKWVWVIALCICFLLCMEEISNVWYKWEDSPVIISYSPFEESVSEIALPALTICPENKVKKTLVDMQRNLTEFQALLSGEKKFISEGQRLLVEAISIVCLKKSNFFELMLPNSLIPTKEHLKIIAEQISPQMDDIFDACYFNAKQENCRKLFRPILTSFGLCYSFNTLDDLELYDKAYADYPLKTNASDIRKTNWEVNTNDGFYGSARFHNDFPKHSGIKGGPYYNLQVILKNNAEDVQDICSMDNADAFRFTVQSHKEFPEPTFGYFHHVVPGVETSIVLKPSLFTTSWQLKLKKYDPHKRGCFMSDISLKIFKEYTMNNCLRECLYQNMTKYCNCTMYYTATNRDDNTSYCTITNNIPEECGQDYIDKFHILFNDYHNRDDINIDPFEEEDDFPCDCLPDCGEVNYPYHVSHSDLSKSRSGPKSNFTKIRMYYESDTFMYRHRSELFGVTDFIANCGGLLGLFTGFSIITAIEIVYFTTMRLFCKLKRNVGTTTNKETTKD